MTLTKHFLWMGLFLIAGINCGQKEKDRKTDAVEPTEHKNPDESIEVKYSAVIETEEELPICDNSRIQQLVWVETSEKFKVCKNAGWHHINIKAQIDQNTLIYAENITLSKPSLNLDSNEENTIGHLKSKNLKDAIENELAPDLAKIFKGSKWKIDNKVTSTIISDNSSIYSSLISYYLDPSKVELATIIFDDTGMSFTFSGCFLVLNYAACTEGLTLDGQRATGHGQWELVGNKTVLVKFGYYYVNNSPPESTLYTVVQILEATNNKIVLFSPNIGSMAGKEVSVLTLARE